MLGYAVKQVFSDTDLIELTRHDFDITDLDKTVKIISEIKPEYIIHSAAYTDVDGNELDPEKAYLVNSIGTRNVSIACEEIKCPVLYLSTDYVFDGSKKEPYNEWDRKDPVNMYGRSKLIGEHFVTSLTNRFYIVRTSWLYGKNGKNFVDTILRLLSDKQSIEVVNDQTGSPTYTLDLAEKIRELLGKGYGTYHITNSSQCSWFEFALEIARIKDSKTEIIPVSSKQYVRPAKRPAFSVLNNTMLRLEGIKEPRSWQEALKEYISL